MKTVFHYFLLLGAFIIPLSVLFEHKEKFPILVGVFLGITVAFWTAILLMRKRKKEK